MQYYLCGHPTMRRGAGKLCHEAPGLCYGPYTIKKSDETILPARFCRHCQIALLRRGDESHRECVTARNRPLEEQSCGVFTSSVGKKNVRCSASGKCDFCKSSLQTTRPSIFTSIMNGSFTHATSSNSAEPPLLPREVSFFRLETGFLS